MADLRADLAALRASVERMTPGPWRLDGPDGFCAVEADDLTANDAVGIAALRNAAPAYLAALARIAEIVEDVDRDDYTNAGRRRAYDAGRAAWTDAGRRRRVSVGPDVIAIDLLIDTPSIGLGADTCRTTLARPTPAGRLTVATPRRRAA